MVELTDPDSGLVRAWRALGEAAGEPNPFYEPDLVLSALRHLPVRDVRLLMAEDDGALVFAAPVREVRGMRRVPLPGLLGWRYDHCPLGTPLLAAGIDAVAACQAVLDLLARRRTPWWITERVGADGPFATGLTRALLERRARMGVLDSYARNAVRRRGAGSAADEPLNGKHRRRLRAARRQLAGGLAAPVRAVQLCEHAGPGELAKAVEGFLAMEAEGWKGSAGGAMALRPGHAEFFREVTAALHARDRLQIWALCAGERTLAYQCQLAVGGRLFVFKLAYDPTVAHYSPGVLLELDVISALHSDERFELLDACTGPGQHMGAAIYPDPLPTLSAVAPVSRVLGGAAALATPLLVAGYHRMRQAARR